LAQLSGRKRERDEDASEEPENVQLKHGAVTLISYSRFLNCFPVSKEHKATEEEGRAISQQVNIYQAMTIEKYFFAREASEVPTKKKNVEEKQNKNLPTQHCAPRTIWITNNSYFDL
jgi:hypothetical protein